MDLKELCRTCLRAGETMVSIFSQMQVPAMEHTELQIFEILKIFTDISLSPDDDLPDHICCDCVDKIRQSYTFKLKFNKSEVIMQQLYGEESKVNQSIDSSNENHSVTCLELIKIENIKDHEKTINAQLEESGLPESFAMKQETFFVQKIKQEPEIEINSTEDCEIFPNKIPFTNLMEPKRTTHVNDKKFKCTMCSKKYSRMPTLNEHILKKHPEKNHFLCDVCPNKFGLKCYLVKHMETAHGYITSAATRKFECVGCSMFFETERVLNDHNLAIHTGDKLFQCKFCPYKYGLETNLTEHMRTAHIKKFPCPTCSKLFLSRDYLNQHMRTHTGVKSYECKVCYKQFLKMDRLICHSLTAHTDKFECVGCSKFFETERLLNEHNMKIHTGDKLFQCEVCSYKFGLETYLEEHMRTVHIPNIIKFECLICSKLFRNDYNLKIHMITHSRQRFKCKVCSKKFKSEGGFRGHLKKAHTDETEY